VRQQEAHRARCHAGAEQAGRRQAVGQQRQPERDGRGEPDAECGAREVVDADHRIAPVARLLHPQADVRAPRAIGGDKEAIDALQALPRLHAQRVPRIASCSGCRGPLAEPCPDRVPARYHPVKAEHDQKHGAADGPCQQRRQVDAHQGCQQGGGMLHGQPPKP
jgi:hypothetical protein